MKRVLFGAVVLALLLGFVTAHGASATHEPANKISASGATAEVISPQENVVLLSELVRTSAPTDLILGVTLECVITTELTTVGNDNASAEGKVRVWVEIDGHPVPVSADDTDEPGKVNFCSQYEERETSLFDDEDATIRTLDRAGAANGFNWLRLDTGAGIHRIEVKADLTTAASDGGDALAAVGKRTLIIEPVKAANDEQITDLAP